MADIDDRPRSARGIRPFEETDELAPRKTRPRTIAIYAALGLGAVWAIVAGADKAEKTQAWGWDPARPILPERKIDWPKSPGLYALDKGRTIPLGGASPAPELSPRAEFLFFDAAVAHGLAALPIHRIPIEANRANAPSETAGNNLIARFLHELNEEAPEARRFPQLPRGSAAVQTLSARVKSQPEILRVVPEEELPPGLYRIADFAHFYVGRKALYKNIADAAAAAAKSKEWTRTGSLAQIALALKPGDSKMEALIDKIPAESPAEARPAIEPAERDRAIANVKSVPSPPESHTSAKTPAPTPTPQALFEEPEDGIIVDRATGLMWTKEEWAQDAAPDIDRRLAARFAEIKVGGHTDWRAPTLSELAQLYERFSAVNPEADRRPPPFRWSGLGSGPAWSMEGKAFEFRTGREIDPRSAKSGTFRGVREAALGPESKIENVSALYPAVAFGYLGLATALLDAGADPDLKLNGIPILNMAVDSGDEPFVRLLIEKGASVSAPSDKGRTPLEGALTRRNLPIAQLLLQKGAEPATLDGLPDLHWAVREGQDDLLELLLNGGRDANLRGPEGRTALMIAAEDDKIDSARILIAHRADLEIADEAGRKAWEFVPHSLRADELRKLLGAPAPKKDEPAAANPPAETDIETPEANSDESAPREVSPKPADAETGSQPEKPSEPMAEEDKKHQSSNPEAPDRRTGDSPEPDIRSRRSRTEPSPRRSSMEPTPLPVKTPRPGPTEAEKRQQAENARLKKDLDASRRRAESARRSARSSKLGAFNDLALLPFDQLLEDSRRLEAAGNLRAAIERAKDAEAGYKTIKGATNLPFLR